jgi:hypothetical protein
MSFDGGHAREYDAEFFDASQNFQRYRKTGLNVDDEERLFHDLIIHMARFRSQSQRAIEDARNELASSHHIVQC